MSGSVQFEMLGRVAAVRIAGTMRLERAIQRVKAALEVARTQGHERLLVDISGLAGFSPPALGDRAYYAREWAEAAGRAMHVAFVARPELIDSEKFGVIFARSFGASVDVFGSEAEALAWLGDRRD